MPESNFPTSVIHDSVIEVADIPFPRPRTDEVVDTPRFIELRRHLWESLREEQTGVTDEAEAAK